MSNWTDELKEKVVEEYKKQNPTADNSTEIVQKIATDLGQSPNGVRQILVHAGVYVKRSVGGDAKPTSATETKTTASTRVSKESQLEALRKAISDKGHQVDEEVISKLTGKAAAYLVTVIK